MTARPTIAERSDRVRIDQGNIQDSADRALDSIELHIDAICLPRLTGDDRGLPEFRIPYTTDDACDRIAHALRLRMQAELAELECVKAALSVGASWALIADEYGITRQAAHKRFATLAHRA